jgi:hypothetical protein
LERQFSPLGGPYVSGGIVLEEFKNPDFLIDKEGIWYADGLVMIRKEIIKLFADHLKRGEDGGYHIEWQGKPYPVRVEDVPFLVQSADLQDGKVLLQLYDSRTLPMPAGSILLKNNVPYLSLFWNMDTRISQNAYSRLSENVLGRDGSYFIRYGGQEWPLEEVK